MAGVHASTSKPILILLNVIPFGVFLVLFARLLDRFAANDWVWFFSLVAAAFGTYLLPFTQTLNNHTVAAYSVFFALYQFMRIWDQRQLSGWRFAGAGFFAAFAAANELPALAFLASLSCLLIVRDFRRTLLYFIPAALIPIAGFAAAQYAVFGEFKLAYESFGTDEYLFEGSLWKTPLDLDALNEHPEPYWVYLFHLTVGHHGIFSLTPIFVFSALRNRSRLCSAEAAGFSRSGRGSRFWRFSALRAITFTTRRPGRPMDGCTRTCGYSG